MSENGKILIIDDDFVNRKVLEKILSKHGFSVSTATNGTEGLATAYKNRPDLIILDIDMPDLSGYEVCDGLQRSSQLAHIPVIFISGLSDLDNKVKGFEHGAVDYLTKPFQAEEVLARIKTHMRLSKRVTGSLPKLIVDIENISPGTVLDDKYKIESKIGSGGFGTVYKATHLQLLRPVAIKFLNTNRSSSLEESKFRLEGISMCRVTHPNAVTIYDLVHSSSGPWYIVMELLEGHTLLEEMQKTKTFPVQRFLEITLQICEVLAEAHRAGIIHRDIKPENIFIHHANNTEIVKVLDFGIAKIASGILQGQDQDIEVSTDENFILGTPFYLAPERIEDLPYDGKADIYSLGIIMYRMTTGEYPFDFKDKDAWSICSIHLKETPIDCRDINPEIGEELAELIMSTLSKLPENRPSAIQLADRLRAIFDVEKGSIYTKQLSYSPKSTSHGRGQEEEDSPTLIFGEKPVS